MNHFADFLSDIDAEQKRQKPKLKIILFDEACRNDTVVNALSTIRGIDYLGADDRPVSLSEAKITDNRSTKILPKYDESYLKAARNANLKTMMLVENHFLTKEDVDKMDRAFLEILKMDLDMLIYYYYYYGFYDEDPEYKMQVVKKHIINFKKNS